MGEAPPHPGPAALAAITHDAYEVDIGAHVFPMAKYRLVRDRLLAEGTIAAGDVMRPDYPPDSHIRLVHTPDYVDRILSGTLSFAEVLRLTPRGGSVLRWAAGRLASSPAAG